MEFGNLNRRLWRFEVKAYKFVYPQTPKPGEMRTDPQDNTGPSEKVDSAEKVIWQAAECDTVHIHYG